jgi:hypothetical protein
VDFEVLVTLLIPGNGLSSGVSPAIGAASIQGDAFFATSTGLFFDFGSTSSSYLKFERDFAKLPSGQPDVFFCLNGGGAECGGSSSSDIAVAVLFPGGQSFFVGKSKSDLVNPANYSGILTDDIFQLAAATSSEAPLPATLPLFLTGLGALGLIGWGRKRRSNGDENAQTGARGRYWN